MGVLRGASDEHGEHILAKNEKNRVQPGVVSHAKHTCTKMWDAS